MPNSFENTRKMVKRHSSPGSLAILVLAGLLFGPRIYDTVRGEPRVTGSLQVTYTSDGRYLVEDSVTASNLVHGDRQILIESEDGTVICSTRWSGSWVATTRRNWELSALSGNSCQDPKKPFRVCSIFSVASPSGRLRMFPPFCSPLTNPTHIEEREITNEQPEN